MMKNIIGKIIRKNNYMHLCHNGMCLVTSSIGKVGHLCDIDKVEDMEEKAYKELRRYAIDKIGFASVERVYDYNFAIPNQLGVVFN